MTEIKQYIERRQRLEAEKQDAADNIKELNQLENNTMTNLTEADVVRLFNDAGLTIDICGSLRVTHKTGTFCYNTEDEDDSGVYIAMHQDTIKNDTFIKHGREYQYHATKGWRNYKGAA
jgi:hypothetical protein